MNVLATLSLTAFALAPAATPATRPAITLVIYPLQPLGTAQDVADRLDAFLRAEVTKVPGVTLVDVVETRRLIEQFEKRGKPCHGNEECLAKIAVAAKATKLIHGTAATLGESYAIDLKLIDVESKSVERRLSELLAGDKAVMIDGVRAIATKLLAPDEYHGQLELRGLRPGAQVLVDGVEVGVAPLPPTRLDPGQHAVKIVLEGFRDVDRFVEIQFGRSTPVEVDFIPTAAAAPPPPPPPRWTTPLFYGGAISAGAGTAVLALGAGLAGLYWVSWAMLDGATEARGANGERVVTNPEQYRSWVGWYGSWEWPVALTVGGLGAAAVAAGAGLMVWQIYAPASDDDQR